MPIRPSIPVVSLAVLALCGCGSDDGGDSEQAATLPGPDQVRAAERAVLEELPDAPIWNGTAAEGVAIGEGEVCVNRYLSPENAKLLGGNGTAHVIVKVPQIETGEPLDGSCRSPEPSPDDRLSDEQLDELAEDLRNMVNSRDGAAIVSTAKSVQAFLDEPLPVATKKANLIHSATVAAIEGVEDSNPDQLDAARRFLDEALAEGD